VYASETLEMGTFMMLAFQLPGMEQGMRLRAVVRDRRGFRCGLEFVDLKVAERRKFCVTCLAGDVIELERGRFDGFAM